MWIFTSNGFISAVKHRDIPDTFMIRARVMGHLEAIFPGEQITQSSGSDYKFRVTVSAAEFMQVVLKQIDAVEYDNFKNSIADHKYHDACTGVWREMHKLQPGSMYADRQAIHPIAGTEEFLLSDDEVEDHEASGWDAYEFGLGPKPDESKYPICKDCGSERLTKDGDITWCQDCCTPQAP